MGFEYHLYFGSKVAWGGVGVGTGRMRYGWKANLEILSLVRKNFPKNSI